MKNSSRLHAFLRIDGALEPCLDTTHVVSPLRVRNHFLKLGCGLT